MPKSRSRVAEIWGRGRLVVVLALAATVATACGGGAAGDDDGGPPRVLTTFTVIADMTRQVGGDRVAVESITRVGAEIHEYEPTPDDLVRGSDADLILDNGMGLERWFDQFVDRTETPAATLSDGVATIPIVVGAEQGQPNPHAWMSPLNGIRYVENIRDALTRLDPAGAPVFRANAERYAAELRRVNDELVAALGTLPPGQRALVTCEGAFSYLARDAGLGEAYLWPVNSDAEGTPQQIVATAGFVRENRVPAVFCESTVNDGAQRQVAADTGTRLGPPLYVDSLSEADGPVPSYLELLRYDARTIAATLTAGTPA